MKANRKADRERLRLRSRVLAEWRGVHAPPDLRGYERRVCDLIPGILRKAGLADRILEEEVVAEWNRIVGPFLARHSRPSGLRKGVLTVSVMSATVRYDLERNHRREILARLQEKFGGRTVRDIRFSPG